MAPGDRTRELLAVAVRLAAVQGYMQVTRQAIAEAAGCSPALVSHSLGTVPAMRRSLMRAAVASRCLPVIAQGLAVRDVYALRAPLELREAAAADIL